MLRSELEKALDGIPADETVTGSGRYVLLVWHVDGVVVLAVCEGARVLSCFGRAARRGAGLVTCRETGEDSTPPVQLETVEAVEAWLDEHRSALLRVERAMVEHYRTTTRHPHRIDLSRSFRMKLAAELAELCRYPVDRVIAEEARVEVPPEIVMHGPGGTVTLYVAELPPGVDLRVIDARSPRVL